jgi:hypothetical protein
MNKYSKRIPADELKKINDVMGDLVVGRSPTMKYNRAGVSQLSTKMQDGEEFLREMAGKYVDKKTNIKKMPIEDVMGALNSRVNMQMNMPGYQMQPVAQLPQAVDTVNQVNQPPVSPDALGIVQTLLKMRGNYGLS